MCQVCRNNHAGVPCPVKSFRGAKILGSVSADVENEKEPLIQLNSDAQVLQKFVGILKRLSFADVKLICAHPGLRVDEFRRELVLSGKNTEQEVELSRRCNYEMVLSKLFFEKDLREFHSPEIIARLERDPLSSHPFMSDQFMVGLLIQARPQVRPQVQRQVQERPQVRQQAQVVKLAVQYVVRREMEAEAGEDCSVCLEELDSKTVCTLTCNHQYCSTCFTSMVRNRVIRCCLCRDLYKTAFVPDETVREEVIGFAIRAVLV